MNTQMTALKNATGKIDYTLLNNCMFHTVMQRNKSKCVPVSINVKTNISSSIR